MYILQNGKLVLEDRILENHELLIVDGRIKQIAPQGMIDPYGLEQVDVRGGYVSPGFIDLHSDYIEHMVSPRPTSILDFHMAIREVEKQLINQGITTMYHSLSLYKTSFFSSKLIRSTEQVKKLVDAIEVSHGADSLIRHRFHARYEIDNVDSVGYLVDYIKQKKIHLLSFMDHTPGQGQFRNLEIYRETINGYQAMSEEAFNQHIVESQSAEKLDVETIRIISSLAKKHGVPLASHDDDSVEKLDLVKSFGTTISEFPITIEVARAAQKRGMLTLGGAPNVLLGGSHSGNLNAAEAIQEGCIDILCSDYYPASLLHGVFILHREYGQDLAAMFRLVTLNPAKAVGIADQFGSLQEGKKADLFVMQLDDKGFPVITSVFVDGSRVSQLNYGQRMVV